MKNSLKKFSVEIKSDLGVKLSFVNGYPSMTLHKKKLFVFILDTISLTNKTFRYYGSFL